MFRRKPLGINLPEVTMLVWVHIQGNSMHNPSTTELVGIVRGESEEDCKEQFFSVYREKHPQPSYLKQDQSFDDLGFWTEIISGQENIK